ncbi:hypothetical protein [Daejeonella oryzae]|nr:hypothetical protein [Daejeonella oryzae]
MKKNQNLATQKLIKKFDDQLLDILSAELRSVKYSKTKTMSQAVIAA